MYHPTPKQIEEKLAATAALAAAQTPNTPIVNAIERMQHAQREITRRGHGVTNHQKLEKLAIEAAAALLHLSNQMTLELQTQQV